MLLRRGWRATTSSVHTSSPDGSMSKLSSCRQRTGQFPTDEAVAQGLFYFRPGRAGGDERKGSMPSRWENWMLCIDERCARVARRCGATLHARGSGLLEHVLIKPSGYPRHAQRCGLAEEQGVYNADMATSASRTASLTSSVGWNTGRPPRRHLMAIVGAGIGYVWGAACVRWRRGPLKKTTRPSPDAW